MTKPIEYQRRTNRWRAFVRWNDGSELFEHFATEDEARSWREHMIQKRRDRLNGKINMEAWIYESR